jgi:hypothetical protein
VVTTKSRLQRWAEFVRCHMHKRSLHVYTGDVKERRKHGVGVLTRVDVVVTSFDVSFAGVYRNVYITPTICRFCVAKRRAYVKRLKRTILKLKVRHQPINATPAAVPEIELPAAVLG